MMGKAPAPAPSGARRPAAGRQRDRAAAKQAGPSRARGGAGKASATDIELAVRIRPGPLPVVGVGGGGAVQVAGESFGYQSSVVCGSDQVVAFDALASRLVSRAQEGYSCTLMAYGQTGSGKTHTMFGPPGCLTEASVAAAGGGIPAEWGLFPRTVLTMMQAPGVEPGSVHASAVEVYHEDVFDLLDDRSQLAVGTSKPKGQRIAGGKAENGNNEEDRASLNGVHPASCTCRKCFEGIEKAKEAAKAARQAKIAAARSGGGAGVAAAYFILMAAFGPRFHQKQEDSEGFGLKRVAIYHYLCNWQCRPRCSSSRRWGQFGVICDRRRETRPPKRCVKMMNFVLTTRNCVSKTRNCVSKTRDLY